MSEQAIQPCIITQKIVPTRSRTAMLPRYFGANMMLVESLLFHYMNNLSSQYNGGYWEFIELSNGGFLMSLQCNDIHTIKVAGNYFENDMSSEAACIVACLFAYSHAANAKACEKATNQYHLLREFALDHPEARLIISAID